MTDPTIFIVDDDASVRDSLSLLLGLKGYATRSFASAEDFLSTCQPDWHGCLLLDIRMPGMKGLELQQHLISRQIFLPIIFITGHGDVAATRAALKAGAADFLEKPLDDRLLLTAIADALKSSAHQRDEAAVAQEIMDRISRLTAREREVMEKVTLGEPNREIARRLGISPRTVEVYKARMMEKMRTQSLPELVRLVLSIKTSEPSD
ncbi:DNA-binding response regulator [Sulfurimicrobium lacus]|uniref:DNA-binding response regulator n=1 Tax=Sulfurimicrobium lacus TaxID=2715678 RepID=A0A6F8VFD3_9PROT|nr:response regulator [Sulfurimicrobium lacus]BCB27429.1 DNA-binding response regulator [Sulfurimicrobium lacus]